MAENQFNDSLKYVEKATPELISLLGPKFEAEVKANRDAALEFNRPKGAVGSSSPFGLEATRGRIDEAPKAKEDFDELQGGSGEAEGKGGMAFSLRRKLTEAEFSRPEAAPKVVNAPNLKLAGENVGEIARHGREWLQANKADLVARIPEPYELSGQGIGKLKQVKTDVGEDPAAHFAAVAALPELLEHSHPVARFPDRAGAPDVAFIERRYAWANFDGKRRNVLITLRYLEKEAEPPRMYSVEALEVRNAQGLHGDIPREQEGPTPGHPGLGSSVSDFMAGVKPEHKRPHEPGNTAGGTYAFSVQRLPVKETLANATHERLDEIRAQLPKLEAVPRIETPQAAFKWFEENLAGKTIETRAGIPVEVKPGHFSALTSGSNDETPKKGFVPGYATADDYRAALRNGEVPADKIPEYSDIRARQLQFVERTLREGLPLRSVEEPWKIAFAASSGKNGFVVITIDGRNGKLGILSAHDRNIGDIFLRKYEVVAPSSAGDEGDTHGGAMPAEHSAAQEKVTPSEEKGKSFGPSTSTESTEDMQNLGPAEGAKESKTQKPGDEEAKRQAYVSPREVRAAYRAGKLEYDEATEILRRQFAFA